MNEVLYGWIAAAVAFVIMEMFTTTLYGASMSIGAAVVAVYVFFFPESSVTLAQGVLFAVTSGILAVVLPKWLMDKMASGPGFKTGLDAAIGRTVPIHRAGDDWKVKIDGVDYLVADESVTSEFESGKKVRIVGHSAGSVQVEA